jgi:hypothetical protein
LVATRTGLTFQQEAWLDVELEVLAIAERHWDEIAVHKDEIKLDLDCQLFRNMQDIGILHITTARAGGELVGYYAMVIRTHPNYKTTKFGFLQSYFLLPEFRAPFTGMELFEAMEEAMRKAGAECLISGHKLSLDVGPLFKRLGWTPFEMMYTKLLK